MSETKADSELRGLAGTSDDGTGAPNPRNRVPFEITSQPVISTRRRVVGRSTSNYGLQIIPTISINVYRKYSERKPGRECIRNDWVLVDASTAMGNSTMCNVLYRREVESMRETMDAEGLETMDTVQA